jgi:hypothetical protein
LGVRPVALFTAARLREDEFVLRLRGDFNGLFGEILCLSHEDTCSDETGARVKLEAGMLVTAFDEDADERGQRDDLVATGVVEAAPDWLECRGSKWVLKIDGNGVRHESELRHRD